MPIAGPMAYVTPVLLLIASNVFMTLAWYGHLNYKSKPLMLVIVVAWGIAFVNTASPCRLTGTVTRSIRRRN